LAALPVHPLLSCPPHAGSISDISWTEVEVGNLIVVYDDELFPADLMCLYSELPDNVCFIKTTNLDGETNLKIRKPLDLKGLQVGAGC
jgi:magnesium-transporting ATPase (P-type)